jgi:hypothetical protein
MPWLVCLGAGCSDHVASSKRHPAPGEGAAPATSAPDPVEPAEPEPAAADPSEPNTGDSENAGGAPSMADSGAAGSSPSVISVGQELRIDVGIDGPAFVQLSTASEVAIDGGDAASLDWDLVFRGGDLFTNGGASGAGQGAAFGPLPLSYFLAAEDPTDVPFLIEDKSAGAFRDWYAYDEQWHALYSRFHDYGVKSGEQLFKLQVLGYYGDFQGAPISALYQLRYAEVTPGAQGSLVEVMNLDATAGGLGGSDSEPGGCLSLATGQQQALTPSAALASTSWDLCFRRDAISVNGGLGGPGGVTAVDLDAAATEIEMLSELKTRSAAGSAAAFAALDAAALSSPELEYHGDRIVSAFTDGWLDTSQEPARLLTDASWLVVGADGASRFLLVFSRLEPGSSAEARSVVLRIQRVR